VNVTAFLMRHRLKIVDKRPSKGRLWVVGGPELKVILDQLKGDGIRFQYVSGGGKATDGRPGWFMT
jgi:hypothetical protein